MEKNRGTVIAVIAALVVSVISLGVAFATFSRSLTINGNATVVASTWDIHFSETELNGDNTGEAASGATIENSAEAPQATASGTLNAYTFDWTGEFQQPGDKVKFEFWIVNAGTYTANLSAPTVSAPNCTIGGQSATCPNFNYTVTKADGTTAFSSSDTLAAGASVKVVVQAELSYPTGMDANTYSVPSAITATFPTVTFAYSQASSN